MIQKITLTRLNIFIASAVLLMVAGLVVDNMMAAPRLREIRDLNAERGRLHSEIINQRSIEAESRHMARLLGVEELNQLPTRPDEDAITYLGAMLDEAKLVRLDLTTHERSDMGSLQRTSFMLRVKGDFKGMQRFVQNLEHGSRLATLDAFKIKQTLDLKELEGRFNLSIYDPKERR